MKTMKTMTTILAAVVLMTATACMEKKTESTSTVSGTDTVQSSTTTISTTVPAVDTATTAAMKADAKDAAHDAAQAGRDAAHDVTQAGRDAAHATGTAMETAGKEIQRRSKPPHKY